MPKGSGGFIQDHCITSFTTPALILQFHSKMLRFEYWKGEITNFFSKVINCAYQHQVSHSLGSCFDDLITSCQYLCWGSSQNLWRMTIAWKRALVTTCVVPSSIFLVSCNFDGLVLIMYVIITTNGLSRNFHPSYKLLFGLSCPDSSSLLYGTSWVPTRVARRLTLR